MKGDSWLGDPDDSSGFDFAALMLVPALASWPFDKNITATIDKKINAEINEIKMDFLLSSFISSNSNFDVVRAKNFH